jgi:hypothetical protein
MEHSVCGVGCEPYRQSGRDDWKVFAVERADRRNQSEDETRRGQLIKIYWALAEPTSGFGITSTAAFSVSNHRLP